MCLRDTCKEEKSSSHLISIPVYAEKKRRGIVLPLDSSLVLVFDEMEMEMAMVTATMEAGGSRR